MTLHALDDKRALAAKQAANLRRVIAEGDRYAQQRDKDGRLLSDRRT